MKNLLLLFALLAFCTFIETASSPDPIGDQTNTPGITMDRLENLVKEVFQSNKYFINYNLEHKDSLPGYLIRRLEYFQRLNQAEKISTSKKLEWIKESEHKDSILKKIEPENLDVNYTKFNEDITQFYNKSPIDCWVMEGALFLLVSYFIMFRKGFINFITYTSSLDSLATITDSDIINITEFYQAFFTNIPSRIPSRLLFEVAPEFLIGLFIPILSHHEIYFDKYYPSERHQINKFLWENLTRLDGMSSLIGHVKILALQSPRHRDLKVMFAFQCKIMVPLFNIFNGAVQPKLGDSLSTSSVGLVDDVIKNPFFQEDSSSISQLIFLFKVKNFWKKLIELSPQKQAEIPFGNDYFLTSLIVMNFVIILTVCKSLGNLVPEFYGKVSLDSFLVLVYNHASKCNDIYKRELEKEGYIQKVYQCTIPLEQRLMHMYPPSCNPRACA